jgi:hypothetical protein
MFTALLAVSWGVLRQNPRSLVLMLCGLGLIVIGGVGLEFWIAANEDCEGLCRRLEILVEETLEMGGTLLICTSLVLWRDAFLARMQSLPDG